MLYKIGTINMKIYIAGPITINKDNYKEPFLEAEKYLDEKSCRTDPYEKAGRRHITDPKAHRK